MNYGSVCSGIEAATVAWHSLGWKPEWFSEIEKFPSQVLAHHYPDVPNLGDMTKIAALIQREVVDAPDVLVGGTPCQAFSVAGLRNSLNDDRGQLSLEFVRLANEIDSARLIRGLKPSIVVWENVPGVLNTSDNAFGCFLGALSGEGCELQPAGKKWPNAGCVYGPQRQIAWRVLDAQYFGVAQRRKRVFVVASSRKECIAEILFERKSMPGDIAKGGCKKKNYSASIAKCLTRRGAGGQNLDIETASFVIHGTQDPIINNDIAHCLGRNRGQENAVFKTAATLTRGFGDRGVDADQIANGNCAIEIQGVRRFTPVECERLQGFPDNYTNVVNATDTPRYAALGNSMAVPVMKWIGERIQEVCGGCGMNINKSEFLELVKAESVARKSTAPVTGKEKLRKQLNRDVKKFLKSGGQVEQLPGTEFKPRPQRSTVETPSSYASSLQVNRLIKWCNSSATLKPRRTYLSELTGIPLYRIRGSITTAKRGARLTKDEHQKIIAVMAQVEELETQSKQGEAA